MSRKDPSQRREPLLRQIADSKMLLLMCVLVGLQSTPVLDWMVP